MTLTTLVMLIPLTIASITDARRHKIYNWTTYPGILAGCAAQTWEHGWPGFEDSVVGFVTCGLIMLLCFVLFNMGGGDVKLIAMMGAGLGLQDGVEAMLWTFTLAFIVGLAMIICQIGFTTFLRKLWEYTGYVIRAGGKVPVRDEDREPLQRWLFLAPAALAAMIVVRGRLFQ
ncbi:A24 family peptidase [Maioricimonas sp. JC845]|uniref:A24 family peptidase n=1 Tax=Maioricimonas sp. JC845 TaxID=3232138 RepID=UPI00345A4974